MTDADGNINDETDVSLTKQSPPADTATLDLCADRRTYLGLVAGGLTATLAGTTRANARHAALSPPPLDDSDVVFEDDFEDGVLDWTDVDHPEFWSEKNEKIYYDPSSSAGSTGDNALYANATFDGDQGLLEWPVAIEVKGYASDTSSGLGAFVVKGGPKDFGPTKGDAVLGISDSKHNNQFGVINSEGKSFNRSPSRDNNTWYTYRLIPDLENDVVHIERNDETWTVPEPGDEAIGNVSIALSGGTCWGCGGTGNRRYESIRVYDLEVSGGTSGSVQIIDATADVDRRTLDGATSPENVWILGDEVVFDVAVRNEGDEPFTGTPDFRVNFWDEPDQGAVDVDWNLQSNSAQEIYQSPFSPSESVTLDPGEVKRITHTVKLKEQSEMLINGFHPSLAYTDRIEVLVEQSGTWIGVDDNCDTSKYCLQPEDIVIRAGLLEMAGLVFAILGGVSSVISSEKLDAAAELGEQAVWAAELGSPLVLAMTEYRQGDYKGVEDKLKTFFSRAGYSTHGDTMAGALRRAVEQWDKGNKGQATGALLEFSATLLIADTSTHGQLGGVIAPLFEFLLGSLEFANVNDVIPTLARSISNMSIPKDPFDPTPGDTAQDVTQPSKITGRVLDQDDNPVANADVNIYTDDPRGGDITPYTTATTDAEGNFTGAKRGPESLSILYFTVLKDGELLTSTPWSEVYEPGYQTLPDQSSFLYLVYVNTEDATGKRPDVAVDIDVREITAESVRFRLRLEVVSGTTEVMSWGASGGVHARLPKRTYASVGSGDFDAIYFADNKADRVSAVEDASIVELTTNQALSAGATLETGDLVVDRGSDDSPVRIAHRAWGWDSERPITVDGKTYNFIARAPPGPSYNRHEFDPTYTFLAYPTRVWTEEQNGPALELTAENQTATAGDTVTVTYTVENVGTAEETSLQVEPTTSPSGVSVQSVEASEATTVRDQTAFFTDLAPGGTYEMSVTYSLTADIDPGTYSLGARTEGNSGATDTISTTLEVTESGAVVGRYDDDDSGTIDNTELLDALADYPDTVSNTELLELLSAYEV